MSQGKRIFIDCGGHDGCSVVQFLSGRPDFSCVTFEPNEVMSPYYRFLPTRLVKKAVSTHDGTVEFIVDPLDGDGSSILEGKDVVYDGSLANTECPRVVVGCVDLSSFVKAHVRPEDYLVLKIDVEGAEYGILEKMLQDGTVSLIDEFYAEFHWEKCGVSQAVHDQLVAKLQQHFEVIDWDAGALSVHGKGWKSAVRRAAMVSWIWIRRVLSGAAFRPHAVATAAL
jgi:FkbM family methyltransferase